MSLARAGSPRTKLGSESSASAIAGGNFFGGMVLVDEFAAAFESELVEAVQSSRVATPHSSSPPASKVVGFAMRTANTAPALDRLVDTLSDCLTPESARRLLALKADANLGSRPDRKRRPELAVDPVRVPQPKEPKSATPHHRRPSDRTPSRSALRLAVAVHHLPGLATRSESQDIVIPLVSPGRPGLGSGDTRGRWTVNRVPRSGSDANSIRPPCNCTIP